jgi:hypothetical protein
MLTDRCIIATRVQQVEQHAFVLLAEAAKIFEDQGHNVDWHFALVTAGRA